MSPPSSWLREIESTIVRWEQSCLRGKARKLCSQGGIEHAFEREAGRQERILGGTEDSIITPIVAGNAPFHIHRDYRLPTQLSNLMGYQFFKNFPVRGQCQRGPASECSASTISHHTTGNKSAGSTDYQSATTPIVSAVRCARIARLAREVGPTAIGRGDDTVGVKLRLGRSTPNCHWPPRLIHHSPHLPRLSERPSNSFSGKYLRRFFGHISARRGQESLRGGTTDQATLEAGRRGRLAIDLDGRKFLGSSQFVRLKLFP